MSDLTGLSSINGSISGLQDSGLREFISTNSGSWTGGGGDGVSGTNVVYVPDYEGADAGNYYSATVNGDVIVTTGSYYNNGATIMPGRNYSLSSIGADIGNKLDKNKIEDSNTIAIINNHAEVTDKAYRTTGFVDISAHDVDTRNDRISIEFNAYDSMLDAKLYSAIIIIETTTSGTYIPDGWSLVSYENNSATFTKYYPLKKTSDDFNLYNVGGWGNFTKCEASATVFSAVEIAPLAFKDDIPTGGGGSQNVLILTGTQCLSSNGGPVCIRMNDDAWRYCPPYDQSFNNRIQSENVCTDAMIVVKEITNGYSSFDLSLNLSGVGSNTLQTGTQWGNNAPFSITGYTAAIPVSSPVVNYVNNNSPCIIDMLYTVWSGNYLACYTNNNNALNSAEQLRNGYTHWEVHGFVS